MSEKTSFQYLDFDTLARIDSMSLLARTVVEGFVMGLHRSPFRGFSVEFAEYRQYSPGDDVRHVDWKVYGKSDRFYVKQYEEETNLSCHVLLDCSASMGYGSGKLTKLQYGCYLAASLAYFMMQQRDATGLVLFDEPLHEMAEGIKRRGLMVLISDLYDEPRRVLDALQHFKFQGSDLIVFQIADAAELNFPFERMTEFVDPETHESVTLTGEAVRKAYMEEKDRFFGEYRRGCADLKIDYHLFDTSTPLELALSEYLYRRSRSY